MDKVFNNIGKEITLPDTLESLVAQLSIRAMQSVDIEACKKGETFFNDEEFEKGAEDLMRSFCQRLLVKASNNCAIKMVDYGSMGFRDWQSEIDKESIKNTEI